MINSSRHLFAVAFLIVQLIAIGAAEPSNSDSHIGFRRPIVTITFDDAWISQYQEALPLLERYKIFATFYILTGSLDKPDYMTRDQVLALHKAGHEIGAHTVTHPDLNTLSLFQVEQELKNSKQFLEDLIKKPVPNFAAPYGSASNKVLELIRKFFKSNRSISFGLNTKNTLDQFKIRALPISTGTTFSEIEHFLEDVAKYNAWAVLIYHRIDAQANQMSITLTEFETHLKEIQNRNLTTLTIQEALQEVLPQSASINFD